MPRICLPQLLVRFLLSAHTKPCHIRPPWMPLGVMHSHTRNATQLHTLRRRIGNAVRLNWRVTLKCCPGTQWCPLPLPLPLPRNALRGGGDRCLRVKSNCTMANCQPLVGCSKKKKEGSKQKRMKKKRMKLWTWNQKRLEIPHSTKAESLHICEIAETRQIIACGLPINDIVCLGECAEAQSGWCKIRICVFQEGS